jgi:membrane-bound ClpP family serine protease
MLDWFSVAILIIIGLILIIVELVFVPGTTVVGILGFIFSGVGIYLSFIYYGPAIGFVVLGASAVIAGIVIYISFKGEVWKKFALNSAINSRVNEEYKYNLLVGDTGKAVSSLKPIGKAEFNDIVFEVRSHGRYVDSGEPVKIIRIESNRIFVEPINLEPIK